MEQQDFINYNSTLCVVDQLKSQGPAAFIGMEWEVDPAKMELSLLASAPIINPDLLRAPGTEMKVEWVIINSISSYSKPFDINTPELGRFSQLYDLVLRGVKLIPPICIRTYRVRNGTKIKPDNDSMYLTDGEHRLAVVKALKREVIPILYIDVIGSYVFDRKLYTADPVGDHLIFTNKDTGSIYKLALQDVYPEVDGSGDWVFHVNML